MQSRQISPFRYLSQIENGLANLNLANLESIGQALGIPLVTFFVTNDPPQISITRRAERRWYNLGDHAAESPLVKAGGDLEIFTIRLSASCGSVPDSVHQGEEFTYVLRGSVRIVFDNRQTYDLAEGDIVYYLSSIAHRWENIGETEAEILVVNTPATY